MSDNTLSRSEAVERALLVREVTYEIHLDLTGDDRTFGVQTTVRFGCSEPGASTFIDFTAPEVGRASLNGTDLPPEAFDGNRLQLSGLQERNVLVISGRGAYSSSSVGLHRFVDPADGATYVHTQFEPFKAHRVFPCFDQPDLKATFHVSALAPSEWLMVGNGSESSERMGSNRHWSFAVLPEISSYLVALAGGPFHVAENPSDGVPLRVYCRRSLAEYLDADDIMLITRQGFDHFTELFDYPYPFGKYDQVFVPEFSAGAMENPGCVTFNERYLFRTSPTATQLQSRASTILHELAHMWFGDLVTMRWWDDLWLNESFATYAGTRALAEATRFTDSWARFAMSTKSWAYSQDQLPTTHPISADIVDTESLHQHFDGITYAKGASVLRQLAAWVGQDAFDEGLREYFRRHAFGNADRHDFLAVLEKASGRALAEWSGLWLETAGVNSLRPVVVSTDGAVQSLALAQSATDDQPTLRAQRIGVGSYARQGSSLVQTSRVEIDVAGELTHVPALTGSPAPDLLLLNDGDLGYVKTRFDPRSLETVVAHLGDLADPLDRAVCWSTLWDMVRDAELPASRFLGIVGSHTTGESSLSLLQQLLNWSTAAIERFIALTDRPAPRAAIAATAFEHVQRGGAERDAQRTWVEVWIRVTDDVSALTDLLTGRLSLPGVTVDVELRWQLIAALCVRGGASTSLVDAELQRDATDLGRRHADQIRAACPSEGSKVWAWDTLLTDDRVSLARKKALAEGFFQSGQESLLQPYVKAYFDALPGIWASQDVEEAQALTAGLYPMKVMSPDIVAMTERALEDRALPRAARRILLEGVDDGLRALMAQAVDAHHHRGPDRESAQ